MQLNKIILLQLNKHFIQIKKGGIKVILKKIRSFIYLILHMPVYFISIPVVIIIRLIKPWFLIRWHGLNSSRIGHFARETELYCCERDAGINSPSQRYIDFFYLGKKYVCNKQLEKMWRRKLIVLPTFLLAPLYRINRFINIFVSGGKYHEVIVASANDYFDNSIQRDPMRDVHNLLERFQPHISFTDKEEFQGKKILTEFGIPKDAKFVCLNVRDSSYLDRHKKHTLRDWSYHNYRDGDIDKYILSAEELTKRGYYIFRMGVKVLKPLKSSNPKIIDYAKSGMRTEFMDIYLGAKCNFCISTSSGFDEIPTIFRRPVVLTGFANIGYMRTESKRNLIIPRHHIYQKSKKRLTLSEIFSSNVAIAHESEKFEQNGIELEENSPEEIKDLIIEIDERLNGRWKDTKEDLLLQKRFWSIFEEKMNQLKLKYPMHGKMNSKIGTKFLRSNQNWLS